MVEREEVLYFEASKQLSVWRGQKTVGIRAHRLPPAPRLYTGKSRQRSLSSFFANSTVGSAILLLFGRECTALQWEYAQVKKVNQKTTGC